MDRLINIVVWIGLAVSWSPHLWAQTETVGVAGERTASAEVVVGTDSWLGIWMGDAIDGGVQIVALVPAGPAQHAGLRVGDILIEANGRELGGQDDLGLVLDEVSPGESLRLVVLRNAEQLERSVEVGRRQRPSAVFAPPRPVAPASPLPATAFARLESLGRVGWIGLTVTDVTPDLRRHYGAPPEAGVLVTRVVSDTSADLAGLRVGDIIVEVGSTTIVDATQLRSALLRWKGTEALDTRIVRGGAAEALRIPAAKPATAGVAWGGARVSAETRQRRIELEIERLERRLRELRRELDRLPQD